VIGHPKDRGKNHLNSRTNSLKPNENDAANFISFWLDLFYLKNHIL
jgi:hypothetical protein